MTFNERIRAVHILQRFVRLSRTLLPLYSDLMSKSNMSDNDIRKADKIRSVYDNFHADPEASRFLINSDILASIQRVYQILNKGQRLTPQNLYEYDRFIKESDRLIHTWNLQLLN